MSYGNDYRNYPQTSSARSGYYEEERYREDRYDDPRGSRMGYDQQNVSHSSYEHYDRADEQRSHDRREYSERNYDEGRQEFHHYPPLPRSRDHNKRNHPHSKEDDHLSHEDRSRYEQYQPSERPAEYRSRRGEYGADQADDGRYSRGREEEHHRFPSESYSSSQESAQSKAWRKEGEFWTVGSSDYPKPNSSRHGRNSNEAADSERFTSPREQHNESLPIRIPEEEWEHNSSRDHLEQRSMNIDYSENTGEEGSGQKEELLFVKFPSRGCHRGGTLSHSVRRELRRFRRYYPHRGKPKLSRYDNYEMHNDRLQEDKNTRPQETEFEHAGPVRVKVEPSSAQYPKSDDESEEEIVMDTAENPYNTPEIPQEVNFNIKKEFTGFIDERVSSSHSGITPDQPTIPRDTISFPPADPVQLAVVPVDFPKSVLSRKQKVKLSWDILEIVRGQANQSFKPQFIDHSYDNPGVYTVTCLNKEVADWLLTKSRQLMVKILQGPKIPQPLKFHAFFNGETGDAESVRCVLIANNKHLEISDWLLLHQRVVSGTLQLTYSIDYKSMIILLAEAEKFGRNDLIIKYKNDKIKLVPLSKLLTKKELLEGCV